MAFEAYVDSVALETATGDQTVSPGSLTFVPLGAMFSGNLNTADGGRADATLSIGAAASSTSELYFTFESEDGSAAADVGGGALTTGFHSLLADNNTVDSVADFTSFNSAPNGFSFNISNAPAAASILNYVLVGGDITIEPFVFNLGSVSGNVSKTGLAGQPSCVVFFTTLSLNGGDTIGVQTSNATVTTGWMCADGTQGVGGSRHTDAGADSDTARWQRTDRCIDLRATGSDQVNATFVSMNANGFTVNATITTVNIRVYGFAIYGGTWKAISFTSTTTTGSTDVATSGINPKLSFWQTFGLAANTATQTGGKHGFGVTDGTRRWALAFDDLDAQPSTVADSYLDRTRALVSITAGTPTLNDAYDITHGTEKITYDHEVASGVAIEVLGLIGGDAAAAPAPSVSDSITLSESVTLQFNPLNLSASDTATLAEDVTVRELVSPAVFDSITLDEAVVVTPSPLSIAVTDAIQLEESVNLRDLAVLAPIYFPRGPRWEQPLAFTQIDYTVPHSRNLIMAVNASQFLISRVDSLQDRTPVFDSARRLFRESQNVITGINVNPRIDIYGQSVANAQFVTTIDGLNRFPLNLTGPFSVFAKFYLTGRNVQADKAVVRFALVSSASVNRGWQLISAPTVGFGSPPNVGKFVFGTYANTTIADCEVASIEDTAVGHYTIAGTADGVRRRLFMNGRMVNEKTTAPFLPVAMTDDVRAYIGEQDLGFDPAGSVFVYVAYVWDRALDPAEILELHNEPYLPFQSQGFNRYAAFPTSRIEPLSINVSDQITLSESVEVTRGLPILVPFYIPRRPRSIQPLGDSQIDYTVPQSRNLVLAVNGSQFARMLSDPDATHRVSTFDSARRMYPYQAVTSTNARLHTRPFSRGIGFASGRFFSADIDDVAKNPVNFTSPFSVFGHFYSIGQPTATEFSILRHGLFSGAGNNRGWQLIAVHTGSATDPGKFAFDVFADSTAADARVASMRDVGAGYYTVAGTTDGLKRRIYVDGRLENEKTTAPFLPLPHVAAQAVFLGEYDPTFDPAGGVFLFVGYAWDRALSAEEILELHNEPYLLFRSQSFDRIFTVPTFQVVGEAGLSIDVSDSIALDESVQVKINLTIEVADSTTGSEQVTVLVNPLHISVFDSATIEEAVLLTTAQAVVINVFDSITLSEDVQVQLNPILLSVSDAITLAEAVQVTVNPLYITVSDSITLSEDVTVIVNPLVIDVSDAITLTESVQVTVNPLYVTVSDSIALSEDVQVQLNPLLISVSDSITLAESVLVTTNEAVVIQVFDTISVSEDVQVQLNPQQVSVFDAITLAEAVEVIVTPLVINVSDAITLAESVTVQMYLPVMANDDTAVTEFVQVTPNPLYVSTQDSATLTEFVDVDLRLDINVFDSSTLTEDVTVRPGLAISVSDSISLSEVVQVIPNPLTMTVEDSIALSEATTVQLNPINLTVADEVTLAESVLVIITTGGVNANVFDSITLTEDVQVQVGLAITVFDELTVQDVVVAASQLQISVSETVTVLDPPRVRLQYLGQSRGIAWG